MAGFFSDVCVMARADSVRCCPKVIFMRVASPASPQWLSLPVSKLLAPRRPSTAEGYAGRKPRPYEGVYLVQTTPKSKGQADSSTPAQSYTPPLVVYEASLEVRAGTPLGIPDVLNLTE